MDKTTTDRERELIATMLLPEETLRTVGERYGVTRERVRQVLESCFSRAGSDNGVKRILDGREALKKIAENLVCIWCGGNLSRHRVQISSHYCSEKCRIAMTKIDKTEQTCDGCGKKYFPWRVRKYYNLKDGYCSFKCYMSALHSGEKRIIRAVKPRLTRVCPVCKTEFLAKHNNRNGYQKYCNRACWHGRNSNKFIQEGR
jgi:hypothetical protein